MLYMRPVLFWGCTQHGVVVLYSPSGRACQCHLQGPGSSGRVKVGPVACPRLAVRNDRSVLHELLKEFRSVADG